MIWFRAGCLIPARLLVILLATGIPARLAAAREYAWIELGFALRHPLTNAVGQRRSSALSTEHIIVVHLAESERVLKFDNFDR
jgi:hypothetical protein